MYLIISMAIRFLTTRHVHTLAEARQTNKLVRLVVFLKTGHKLLSADLSVACYCMREPV